MGAHMYSIDVQNLSISEAEDLLLRVWLALAKHQIATPTVTSRQRASGWDIVLVFGSEAERATVAAALEDVRSRMSQELIAL
jgi:hypothetical protein